MFSQDGAATDRKRTALLACALAGGYVALAWLGLAIADPEARVSPFWPAAGLAMGMLWRCGLALLPGVVLGATVASMLLVGTPFGPSLVIGLGTGSGLGLGAWMLRRLQANPRLEHASDPLKVLLASACGSLLSATVGSAASVPSHAFLQVARTWWTGDLAGVMAAIGVVATLRWNPAALRAQHREIIILALTASAALALCAVLPDAGQHGLSPWAFLLFPPLLYAAVRTGPAGAALTLAIISLAAAIMTASGIGPFLAGADSGRIHFPFQLFIIAASGTTLVLAAYARSQQLAQAALSESEGRFRLVADHARDVICLHEPDGSYRWISPSMRWIVGWTPEQLLRRSHYDHIHPEDVEQVRRALHGPLPRDAAPATVQFRFRRPDGGWIWLEAVAQPVTDATGRIVAFQTSSRDISQRKQDEERLAEMQRSAALSERMASIGTLAGGVAHEFNNLNAVVMGNVELALRRPDLPAEARRRLEQIRDAVDREKGIVDALLTFSRSERSPSEIIDVGHVVSTTLALARRTMRQRRIAVQLDLPEEPLFALVPTGSLGQVLLNLLLNACDAVDRRHDPTVSISLARVGARIRLRVHDNGIGIPAEILPRIFEPFFSTKGEHAIDGEGQPWLRGTGLGLSVCQTLVGHMGGEITVDSVPGAGTAFTVAIPAADAPRPPAASGTAATTCARVLVVDDEPEIRRILCEHLTAAGHIAVEAKDGQQALDHLGAEDVDVVMLNWCMPGVDGQGVLEHMELHPERRWPPVIVVSGWTGSGSGIDRWRREIAGQLRKPFSLEQVRSTVEKALCGVREG